MLSKRIDQLTVQDLEDLVNTHQSENQRLEFKREINVETKEEKKEFLRDLCALANTQGGYYIIGIEEDKGEATVLSGVDLLDADKYKLRLDQIIRENLEPRLLGLQIKHFELSSGKFAVVIFVPRSSFPPHRYRDDTFYERANTGKYSLNMDQIRRVFTRGASLREEIRNFIRERQDIVCRQRDGVVQFTEQSVVMIHFIPISAIESDVSIPINSELLNRLSSFVSPFGGAGHSPGFNADGLIWWNQSDSGSKYTQLFRNGIFEGACDFLIRLRENKLSILPNYFELETVTWLKNTLKASQILDIPFPIQINITIQGAQSASISIGHSYLTNH
jgi:Putative DNA-binding domain